jgi:hypothetical protein
MNLQQPVGEMPTGPLDRDAGREETNDAEGPGIAAVALKVERWLPQPVRETAIGRSLLLALAIGAIALAFLWLHTNVFTPRGKEIFVFLPLAWLSLAAAVAVPMLTYDKILAAVQREWDAIYDETLVDLQRSSMPTLIVDPAFWDGMLDLNSDELFSTTPFGGRAKPRQSRDCLEFAAAYWEALQQSMFRAEAVTEDALLAGDFRLRDLHYYLDSPKRRPGLELCARLTAICDYFGSNLEDLPAPQSWRELHHLDPPVLRPLDRVSDVDEQQQRGHGPWAL